MTDEEAVDLYPLVRRIATVTGVRNPYDHEDTTQEAMLRILQSCDGIPPRGALRHCIVRRAVRDARNVLFGSPLYSHGKRALRAMMVPLVDMPRMRRDSNVEVCDEVRYVMASLSPQERAILLWRSDRLTYPEIGRRVNMHAQKVYRTCRDARVHARQSR